MKPSTENLDNLIRMWRDPPAPDPDDWWIVEEEIRKRARQRARRYQFPVDDVDDVVGEVLLQTLCMLDSPPSSGIRNFDAYISRLITNVCKTQIRRAKPVWTRLKGEIVETLRGAQGAREFAVWKAEGHVLGGIAEWEGQGICWNAHYLHLQQHPRDLHRYLHRRHGEWMDLAGLLAAVLNWLATPVPLDELTSLVFTFRGMCEPILTTPLLEAEDQIPEAKTAPVNEELLHAIAHGFHQLSRPECAAFLFHLAPEVAERLLMRLPANDRAALPCRLNITPEKLESTLDRLPWNDLEIAAFLEIRDRTTQKTQMRIINIRQRALRTIRKHLDESHSV